MPKVKEKSIKGLSLRNFSENRGKRQREKMVGCRLPLVCTYIIEDFKWGKVCCNVVRTALQGAIADQVSKLQSGEAG